MPKVKQQQQPKDFVKVKQKVGKKKVVVKNHTNTSFKSKSIHIPSQQLQKSSELTNHRHQSLQDLLKLLHHHSVNVRKETLHGLKELIELHPQLISSNLTSLTLEPLFLIMDLDENVRKALLNYYHYWLHSDNNLDFTPFLSLLMNYTTSSMTHLNENIRMDALKFLKLWIDKFTSEMAQQLIPYLIGYFTSESKKSLNNQLETRANGKLSKTSSRVFILSTLYNILNPKSENKTSDLTLENPDIIIEEGQQVPFVIVDHQDLLHPRPLPSLEFSWDDEEKEDYFSKLQPVLFNLWSENCQLLQSSHLKVCDELLLLDLILKILSIIHKKEKPGLKKLAFNWLQKWIMPDFPFHKDKLGHFDNQAFKKLSEMSSCFKKLMFILSDSTIDLSC